MGIKTIEIRNYDPHEAAVFWKTKERYGGLSNMAAGFPLFVNQVSILTSEALYQACRFPHLPDVQRTIISQISPMTAKMMGKPFSAQTRPDWDTVKVAVMRWCLRVKLCQNPENFGRALFETEGRDIVEKKIKRADFWGAKVQEDGLLSGPNVLGRLLMELRDECRNYGAPEVVKPLPIPMFELFGKPIENVFSKRCLAFDF